MKWGRYYFLSSLWCIFRRAVSRASKGLRNCNSFGVILFLRKISHSYLFCLISFSISWGVVFVVTRSTGPRSRYPRSANTFIRRLIRSRCISSFTKGIMGVCSMCDFRWITEESPIWTNYNKYISIHSHVLVSGEFPLLLSISIVVR